MTYTKKELKKPVALLDVDNTLIFGDSSAIRYNDVLIEKLIAEGILDVYLFTSMRITQEQINDRLRLIEYLKTKELTVHGVISTCDILWRERELAYEFQQEFDQQIITHGNSKTTDEITRELFSNDRYKPLLNIANTEAGIAFEEGQNNLPATKEQETSLVNAVGVVIKYLHGNSDHEKGTLLTAFLSKKPEWVGQVVVVDDGKPNIDAVNSAAQKLPNESVIAIHHAITTTGANGRQRTTKELSREQLDAKFLPVQKNTFLMNLDKYTTVREQHDEYKHSFFCIGLGHSKTQKIDAVNALKSAIKDPTNASSITVEQLAALRNGELGKMIRSFVKKGGANSILTNEENSITTVREFVQALNNRIEQNNKPTARIG
ncbi:hypothetical protein [Legionella worsleiensis]|uniref:Uncharacterized protein n=1 Tax=Legionella worsleiensis TaxID=45076 RepID=A0A0W1AIG5_9GAMM|nr:hypothetical protein [Legionella worsleiensis]KTD81167.1 hypothetical protein Lwor_0845 [Legionella worsleiensis]STY33142.1 Uncharacterised protein [Legionella worsleiensis]